MRNFIKRNSLLVFIYFLWFALLFIEKNSGAIFIMATLFYFMKTDNYKAILFGLVTVIFISDSRNLGFSFVANLKLAYVIVILFYMFFNSKKFQPYSQLYVPFFLFFLYSTPLVFISETPLISFQKVISYDLVFFLVPNFFMNSYRNSGDEFIKDFLNFLCLFLLVGLLLLPFASQKLLFIEGRFNGLLGNPNGLGLYVSILFILFLITNDLFPNLFSKQERIFNFCLILISAFLSGSRNSILTIIIFLVLIRSFRISSILGFAFMITVIVTKDYIEDFFILMIKVLGLEDFYRIEGVEKASGRTIAWAFGWEKVQEHFIFGHGFNYTNYIYDLNHDELSKLGHQGNAHNSYLTFWLDTGIIGLFLILRGFFLSFYRVFSISPLFLPALLSIMFSMFFESWLAASLNPFTFQVIVMVLIGMVKQEEQDKLESLPILEKKL